MYDPEGVERKRTMRQEKKKKKEFSLEQLFLTVQQYQNTYALSLSS